MAPRSIKSPQNELRAAAILAGGKSKRFGSDKALAPWIRGCVIEAVARAAGKTCSEVFVVADDPGPLVGLNLQVFPDILPDSGPLGGLHSALFRAGGDRILILGCDMPLTEPDLLEWMWSLPTWAPVVVPYSRNGPEPLHAIYHKSLLPLVEHHIKSGVLSIRNLLKKIPKRIVPHEEWKKICRHPECLSSANTPGELKRLRLLAGGRK